MHKLFIQYKISNRILLVLAIVFVCNHLLAQKNFNAKDAYNEAESDFLYEEFSEALPLYAKLKDLTPDNFFLDYRIGRCYLNLPYDRQKSLVYLERAAKHISPNIKKEAQWKEKLAPIDVIFYLADAYRVNNQLTKAIETYNDFKSRGNNVVFDFPLIDHHIASCQTAIEMMKNPIDINEDNLGSPINSRYPKTNPVVSEDESTLVYSCKLPFYEAMFYAKKVNGIWTEPHNMIPDVGVDGDCFPTSISSDGKELYIYRKDDQDGNLFVTNFKNGRWTKLRKLNSNINTKFWESHASISHDGLTLYFTSNRTGGSGGLDIFKTERTATTNDNWGTATNLGPEVNSQYNEEAPFISVDGKHLFFSSLGHRTMGGMDIFSSVMQNGKWSEPANVGYPLNSCDDDIFFCPIHNGTVAYLCKYDPKGYGKSDIIRCEIFSDANPRQYSVNTKILFPDNLPATDNLYLTVYDKNRKDTILKKDLKKDGAIFQLTSGNYDIILKGPGLQPKVVPLAIAKRSKEKEITVNTTMSAYIAPVNSVNRSVNTPGSAIAKTLKPTTTVVAAKEKTTHQNTVKVPSSLPETTTSGKVTDKDPLLQKVTPAVTSSSRPKDTIVAKVKEPVKKVVRKPEKEIATPALDRKTILMDYVAYATLSIALLLAIILWVKRHHKKDD